MIAAVEVVDDARLVIGAEATIEGNERLWNLEDIRNKVVSIDGQANDWWMSCLRCVVRLRLVGGGERLFGSGESGRRAVGAQLPSLSLD